MSRINTPDNSGLRVQIDGSRNRQTPKTSFGDVLGTGLSKTADTVMGAGQMAAPYIPGGAVLSAAITGLGSLKSNQNAGTASAPNCTGLAMPSSQGGASALTGSSSSTMGTVEQMANSGDSGATMFMATKELQEMNQQFNLQYLNMQQEMQSENRKFTALSNVMKTKHDTAKSMIQNVR